MNIAQSSGSDDSLNTSLSFELSASPGDLTYLSLTLNLASEFVKVSNAWDWSGCSTVFQDALEAISDVLSLLQEIHQGIGDPRYILSADLWPLIKACRQQLLTLDEWIISNAPDFDIDVRRWDGTYDPLTNVFPYGRQFIRRQTIADHYKHANREADVLLSVKHALVQLSDDLENHLTTSRARVRSRLEALAHRFGGLSHDSRRRIWHLYGGALQGHRDCWEGIATLLKLPYMRDPLNPDYRWIDDSRHSFVVQDTVKREILTALETMMKTDPIRDAPYEYAPLERPREQIRVITDIQKRPSGEIQLQLETKDLISPENTGPNELKFTALSYTWGTPGEVFYVWIGDRRLPVQRNAFNFLDHYSIHFAHQHSETGLTQSADGTYYMHRPIWIDAICINQTDSREKGQQVSIMGEIYKRAFRVYVWLDGCSDDKTFRTLYNRHLQCVSHRDGPLADKHRDCTETPNYGGWLRGACLCCADNVGRTNHDGAALNIWSSIISHKYWTRIWIIQELSLAQSPPEIILWDTSISVQLVNKTEASKQYYDDLRVDSMVPMSHGSSTLTQLLGKFSDRGCVDARDIVYALLSMTPYAGSFHVDYEEGAEGLIYRALPLMLRERDHGRPSSTVLKDDSLVKLLKVLAMFHSTQLVELCKSMPSEHAAAFQEPHYEIRARRLSVLTLTELNITQTTISHYSADWETILPDRVTLTTSAGTSRFQCLRYHMALGTYTEPDKKTDAVDCAMKFELLDLPIVDGERCFFSMLIAARDGQVEVLCYIRGDHLHPMPSDIKARWQDHLIREGKPWQSICCDSAWESGFDLTLPCSLLEAAHLSDLEDMLMENKELEGDVYDMVDSTSIPDAVRKMCPPAAPLSTLPM